MKHFCIFAETCAEFKVRSVAILEVCHMAVPLEEGQSADSLQLLHLWDPTQRSRQSHSLHGLFILMDPAKASSEQTSDCSLRVLSPGFSFLLVFHRVTPLFVAQEAFPAYACFPSLYSSWKSPPGKSPVLLNPSWHLPPRGHKLADLQDEQRLPKLRRKTEKFSLTKACTSRGLNTARRNSRISFLPTLRYAGNMNTHVRVHTQKELF
ncbi:uncharacterized protein LOC122212114 [Panthera leo]|uniref:uncharacterized protein LOC122212114 n=1 Tax=Panthera leo TaxID=9689 RepID=UPI001C6A3C0C|nr:uncharacterized protein LOC122212114 [Panthera leo]